MQIICAPLGWLMRVAYSLTGNYGLAVIVFTLLTKLVLLPVSLWVHANGIKMVRLEPAVNRLKVKYFGDPDKVADEQALLYKKAHYSPFATVIPVAVQVLLLIGLVQIIYHPDVWLRQPDLNTRFLGFDLSATPTAAGGIHLLIPLLAGLAALILSLCQNKLNPLQASQGKAAQFSSMAVSVGISLVLGFTVPAGVGFYWIWSNLFTIAQQLLLNKLRPPEKEIDWAELEASRKELAAYTDTGSETVRSREEKHREKEDYKRFFSVGNKHLVFYSEGSGFYKYFERIMNWILENSKLTIHYVTSDPNDQIFDIAKKQDRIVPYYIGQKKLITLFMKLEADVMIMTMSDLGNYQYKRSYYSKNIKYVYVFHYPLSTHMVLHTGALRHYDSILCVGDFQFEEIRQTEKLFGDPEQELVACGYGQLEKLYDAYQATPRTKRERPKVLIAPSWQADNILDSCIDDMLSELLGKGFDVTVRPHPEYVKRYGDRMNAIVKRYEDYKGGDLFFELDFTGNTSIFDSDIVISDWSGTAYEFVMVTERPCVFVDTPPKINNPDYEKITVPPLEMTLRDQVGIRVKPEALEGLAEKIRTLLEDESYGERIREIREKTIANFGKSGEVGGRYILDQVKKAVQARNQKA
ncbi:membrane protein insertase YidC [Aristaeella hokkaidonensis]|uniref:Membrane protein insertase YidC n=1 Tax=Aristaeella hokkaidonensis TaxID=3046382 RepID=A0AC61N6L2_9FIRM|nr:membrane protein insertase YidC [Aristaeella hokkaidonensis]QUC66146.1 membrane protein insertase YidC [Aristaeella hokkaidonensis]SNT94848.1 YidC/Oxa1 family membrane protein insertase [Aristaeella hokkaidonensis]